MYSKPTILRTLTAGLVSGAALVAALFLTFALLGGSGQGETGLLFDPDSQSKKLIAIWKEIEPLPLLAEQPATVLVYFLFTVAYAFLYRSVAAAWPSGVLPRTWRLAGVVWLTGAFFEFQGPVNLAHQPLQPLAIALAFWAVAAIATAFSIVRVSEWSRHPVQHHRTAESPAESMSTPDIV